MLFLYGFISCWILLAIITFVRDNMNFSNTATDITDIIIMFPVFIVAMPIYTLYQVIKIQWQNVITPVSIDRWNNISQLRDDFLKCIKIKNFYICFDKNARWVKKLFFVKVTDKKRGDK